MSELTGLLADLFLIFLAAKVAAEVFGRLHQPAVIGELLAGALIGPHALGWIGRPDGGLIDVFHGDAEAAREALELVYHLIAELGVVVLLFFVGLETRVAEIVKVGRRAVSVAVLGVVLPFGLGYCLAALVLGQPRVEAIFVGAALVATSVGITARVLRDLGVIASLESRIILGAAVIDDILALVLLAVVAGLAKTGTISLPDVLLIAGQAILFTAFAVLVGTRAVRRYSLGLNHLKMENAPFAAALITMLGLAALSAWLGLAALIGAFLAGMIFAEAREHFALEKPALPIYQFLVPFFFVLTGSQIDWRLFLDGNVLGQALVVTALAILGKVIGCGLGAVGLSRRTIAIVGVGMVPRGEVGLIVAGLGLSLGAISTGVFNVVVIMSVLTTVLVPPILRVLYRDRPAPAEYANPTTDGIGDLSDLG